ETTADAGADLVLPAELPNHVERVGDLSVAQQSENAVHSERTGPHPDVAVALTDYDVPEPLLVELEAIGPLRVLHAPRDAVKLDRVAKLVVALAVRLLLRLSRLRAIVLRRRRGFVRSGVDFGLRRPVHILIELGPCT